MINSAMEGKAAVNHKMLWFLREKGWD